MRKISDVKLLSKQRAKMFGPLEKQKTEVKYLNLVL